MPTPISPDAVNDLLASPAHYDPAVNEQAEGALVGTIHALARTAGPDAVIAAFLPFLERMEPTLLALGDPTHPGLLALARHRERAAP